MKLKVIGYRTLRTALRWGRPVSAERPGAGITADEQVIDAPREAGDGEEPAGPHVRPLRAGLRLVDTGARGE